MADVQVEIPPVLSFPESMTLHRHPDAPQTYTTLPLNEDLASPERTLTGALIALSIRSAFDTLSPSSSSSVGGGVEVKSVEGDHFSLPKPDTPLLLQVRTVDGNKRAVTASQRLPYGSLRRCAVLTVTFSPSSTDPSPNNKDEEVKKSDRKMTLGTPAGGWLAVFYPSIFASPPLDARLPPTTFWFRCPSSTTTTTTTGGREEGLDAAAVAFALDLAIPNTTPHHAIPTSFALEYHSPPASHDLSKAWHTMVYQVLAGEVGTDRARNSVRGVLMSEKGRVVARMTRRERLVPRSKF